MKKLVIVGCGPRALAVALRASLYDYNITIIDEFPLGTWSTSNMLEDMLMRSPISFDLTTFYPELAQYSLASFLNKNVVYSTQKDVEECTILCTRQEFKLYLNYIYSILLRKNIVINNSNVSLVTETNVVCKNSTIVPYDYLILSTGKNNHIIDIPNYLRNKHLLTIKDIIYKNYTNREVNVIGSGQQAAEIVEYLSRNKSNVTWIQKHTPLVEPYPTPSIKNWGLYSALGNYYSTLSSITSRDEYLMNVKNWGPSITPHITTQLQKQSFNLLLNPSTTKELNLNAYFILALGFKQDIKLLNFNFNIALDKHATNFPSIKKDFQSTSHPNIYFTGLLALRFDGPRQGSIISSAFTATTIINSMNN